MKSNYDEFPIDMVYLWCNGQDPDFIKKKEKYERNSSNDSSNILSTGDIRFFDNDELKYSLRSLEKNAPWINHIFIVTDRQVPKWLNTTNTKVTIIDHSEIIEYSATGVPPIRKSGTAFPRKVYRLSAKVYRSFFRL